MNMKKKRSYEAMIEELEETVAALESGELPLEQSMAAYEKAMKTLRECYRMLERTENTLKELSGDGQGGWMVKDKDLQDSP